MGAAPSFGQTRKKKDQTVDGGALTRRMGFHKAGWTYVEQSAGIMENVADGLQRPQPFFAILSWTRGSHSFDRETGPV